MAEGRDRHLRGADLGIARRPELLLDPLPPAARRVLPHLSTGRTRRPDRIPRADDGHHGAAHDPPMAEPLSEPARLSGAGRPAAETARDLRGQVLRAALDL